MEIIIWHFPHVFRCGYRVAKESAYTFTNAVEVACLV